MITANYILTNSSTVDVLYRMYITVDGVTDAVANKMISITGGPSNFVGELNFKDGVAYVGGSSGTVLNVPVGDDAGKYSFTLTIDSSDLTSCNDFKIKIVNEAYQYDYKYSLVKVISKTGEASLPTGTATDSVSFIGTAPAESGASAASAADTNVTFTAGALNMVTDNGNNAVTLKTEMLDPVNGVAKIKLTLEGAATTNFGTEKVKVSLSIPGKYTGLEVKYNGSGEQPTDVSCVYDSAKNVTNVTFSTTHFSEFEVVAGENSTAEVADADSLIAALSSGISTVTLTGNIDLNKTAFVKSTTILNLNGYKISNTEDIWDVQPNNWSLISVASKGDLTINGNGTLQAKENDCYAVDIQDGGKCTINGGKYIGNIHAVYVQMGSLLITGGEYSVQQKYAEAGKEDEFVINLLDENRKNRTAIAIITGGTYHNFNPSDCWAEGEHTNFLADGYVCVQNDSAYKVIEAPITVSQGESIEYFGSVDDAICYMKTLGGSVTISFNKSGVYDWTVSDLASASSGKSVSFVANVDDVKIDLTKLPQSTADGGRLAYCDNINMNFSNLTLTFNADPYSRFVNASSIHYDTCVIEGKYIYSGNETLTNCTI